MVDIYQDTIIPRRFQIWMTGLSKGSVTYLFLQDNSTTILSEIKVRF